MQKPKKPDVPISAMRWRIRDMLELVVLFAVFLSAFQYYYVGNQLQWKFIFAGYLAVLTIASLACYRVTSRLRDFWQGYALFGWIYFIFVLRGGFDVQTIVDAQSFARWSIMGMIFSVLCAIAAHLFFPMNEDAKHGESADKQQ